MPIEKGTAKVVWIRGDAKLIHSKMFNSAEAAEKFGRKKKNYLVFRLMRHRKISGRRGSVDAGDEFEWELMPYGRHKLYASALKLYKKKARLLEAFRHK